MLLFDFAVLIDISRIRKKRRDNLYMVKWCSLVYNETRRGRIQLEVSAAFVDTSYGAVNVHDVHQAEIAGKTIVIVLDIHSHTEMLVQVHANLDLVHPVPYPLLYNPI
ncbi:hypothetical protein L916_14000 [Phytophthora nicotianae]|uniref:Uncharacterized protein n=1 Tax=Phytophthora nicotianae TaxID=4792 RepID=W2IHK6_PHYNI|nr:hypothetical protein L916_14000 [Phytophthora nicotianae]